MKRGALHAPLCGLALGLAALGACAPRRGETYESSVAAARGAYGAGRYGDAAARFDDAARTAKVPRDAVYARYEAALARARAGDVARATQELRAIAAESNAYSDQAAYKVADLAMKADPAAGRTELEAFVLRFSDSALAKVALDRLLHDDDDTGPAKAIARLDALGPKVAGKAVEQEVAYQRARRLAALGGRDEQARDAFIAVADRWPYPTGPYFDDALFRAAEIEQKLGRRREAVALLERMLSYREPSVTIGSYERPRYSPAAMRIAELWEELGDHEKARDAYRRLYRDFKTSTMRDDALWREAALWEKDGDASRACSVRGTLASDFPDSRYVPCAIDKCPAIQRASKSKAPKTCHAYLTRAPEPPTAN